MAKGMCGCGKHGELFGDSCLECVQKAVAHRDPLERARHRDTDVRTEQLRGRYRGHGDFARTPHHMTVAERRLLSRTDFALREQRNPPALPLRDPTRPGSARGYVMAASARLKMMKNLGHLKPGEWQEGAHHIAEAARGVGIKSHLLER